MNVNHSWPTLHSPSWVEQLSYPDFVAFIGQDNSPPGHQNTVLNWAQMSNISNESNVLDLACSTGYSSRLLSRLIGCNVHGIDLSQMAISEANRLAICEDLGEHASYSIGDALHLPFDKGTFSHIVAGSAFGFIQHRSLALKEAARVLQRGGRLCVASYFYSSIPPSYLLDQLTDKIGYRPNSEHTYDYWHSFFSELFQSEERRSLYLPMQDKEAILSTAYNFVYSDSQNLRNAPAKVKDACWRRLAAIRTAINEHRQYQSVKIMTWRIA